MALVPPCTPVFWALGKKQLAKSILIYMERVPSKKYYLYVLIMEWGETPPPGEPSVPRSSPGDSWDNPKAPSGGNSKTSADLLFGWHGLELSTFLQEMLQL